MLRFAIAWLAVSLLLLGATVLGGAMRMLDDPGIPRASAEGGGGGD